MHLAHIRKVHLTQKIKKKNKRIHLLFDAFVRKKVMIVCALSKSGLNYYATAFRESGAAEDVVYSGTKRHNASVHSHPHSPFRFY